MHLQSGRKEKTAEPAAYPSVLFPYQNRMQQIKITDQHTAESLSHFSMGKGILSWQMPAMVQHRTTFIPKNSRRCDIAYYTKKFPLYDADGKKIPLVPLLKEAEEKHMEMIDIFGFLPI